MKHQHYNEIVAWAEGSEIEYSVDNGKNWYPIKTPTWELVTKYRVKPKIQERLVEITNTDNGFQIKELKDEDISGSLILKILVDSEGRIADAAFQNIPMIVRVE